MATTSWRRRWAWSAVCAVCTPPLFAQQPTPLPMNPMPIPAAPAQQPTTPATPAPQTPAVIAPTPAPKEPTPAPTVIMPAAPVDPAKLAEKQVAFEMRDKPWKGVLEWLSNETGLPIITTATPTGSFSYYGNPKKKYSITEVIDVINEALMNQKFILLRRDASFTIVSADQAIDPAIVPRVRLEDLGGRGSTEVVQVVVQLKSLVAEDIAPEVMKMMGPFREVTALNQSNQLVLQDAAKTLRRVLDTIDLMEKSEGGKNESFAHECKYIKVRDAERILKELLGDPNALLRAMNPPGRDGGRDGGNQQQQQQKPNIKIRMHYVTADDRLNTVLVTGPADKIAQAREIMKKLDAPQAGQRPVIVGPPVLKSYATPAGTADQIARTLQELYKSSPQVRVSSVGGNSVMVYAGPEEHFEVARLIQGADLRQNETTLLPVSGRDAEKVSQTLKGMFQDPKTGAGPYIEADNERGNVIVKGTPEQVSDIKLALKALGEGEGSGNMRVIPLGAGGSSAAIAAELERLLKQMRSNPVRVITPGIEQKPTTPPAPLSPGGNGGGLDQAPLVDPQAPKTGTQEPITITAVGNRLIVSSNDPQALALVQELTRLLTTSSGDGGFEVIKLKNANATDAAKTINDAFNGPAQPANNQGGGNPFGGFPFGGFNRGGGAPAATTTTPSTSAKVRVIADPAANSLLVKAPPLEMLEIKRLLKESIDSGDESRALQKTHVIGPLKASKATEVAEVIKDVYKDSMSNNTTQQSGGGRMPFFMGGGGGGAQRLTDANGNPRGAALTVGIEEATNSLIVRCSDSMYQDIKTLVDKLEEVARGSPRSIKVVSVKGIDPALLQQALEALQAKPNATGGRPSGGAGMFSPFGGGGMGGGGNRGGGGGGGNRGGGGGGRRGGGGNNRAPDREPGGPDFFESGVKDDSRNAGQDAAQFALLVDPQLAPSQGEEQKQPPAGPPPASPDIRGPRDRVAVEALESLGVVIVSAENQQDLEEVLKVIEYIQKLGAGSQIQIQFIPLKQADATQLTGLLNQVFSRVVVGPNGNIAVSLAQQQQQKPTTTSNPFFGNFTTAQDPASSVMLIPMPRFNAILVGAPESRIKDVLKEIERLDIPTAPQARAFAFPLRKASASRVAGQITNFYSTRYPNETDQNHQVRITHDDASNTVFVQASPADLAEIKDLIERIDTAVSSAVNELRIVPLRNALSDELSNILLQAITQGVVNPSSTGAPGIVPRVGGNQNIPGLAGQGLNQQRPVTGATAAGVPNGVTTKSTSLRFYSRTTPGAGVESGLLEDVHVTSEPRSNSLILSAPPKTMDLLLTLIRELDVLSAAKAQMKIFNLRKADAQQTAILLQQFFLGQAARTTGTGGGLAPALGAAANTGSRPLLSLSGQPLEGATLIDLKISVDDRTNSIIVAGSGNDLEVIEALVSRLEDTTVESRRLEVVPLRNATAADVANSLQQFLTNSLTVIRNAQQLTAYQELQRDVVIVPEPISNKLLISASPRYFEELLRLIAQVDMLPAQVVIQILVADVQLTNNEEFGIELGLQSPVLFQRSIIPGTASFAGQASGLPLQNGVTVNSTLPGAANPGFNFNTPNFPQNNFTAGSGIVGFQGLGNLGVGRTSPTSNVGGLVFSAASDTFTLLIRALKLQGRVDILSRPQVMTLDNQTAAVNVGKEIPIVTSTVVNAQGFAQNNIERRNVGVLLKVTPRITPDGKVLMRVSPEISSVDPIPINLGNGQLGTALNIQQVETTVAASDGETVVIGGLIQTIDSKQENKVPWLGDLPYVGAAFRYRTQKREKRELLVILTPHVVRSPEEAANILAQEARRMDWAVGDVCKMHGPNGLDAILPQQPCAPTCQLPGIAPPTQDQQGTGETQIPSVLPSPPPVAMPVRPASNVPAPPPGSPLLPATYQAVMPTTADKPATPATTPAPAPAPAKDTGKESRPWVYRRD
ncbi:MAG: hypothetical protein K1X57_00235 [Gemmataceae bacterium]|nr:hypothetical protein [Gemmataceae bacterium]